MLKVDTVETVVQKLNDSNVLKKRGKVVKKTPSKSGQIKIKQSNAGKKRKKMSESPAQKNNLASWLSTPKRPTKRFKASAKSTKAKHTNSKMPLLSPSVTTKFKKINVN